MTKEIIEFLIFHCLALPGVGAFAFAHLYMATALVVILYSHIQDAYFINEDSFKTSRDRYNYYFPDPVDELMFGKEDWQALNEHDT